MKTVHRFLANNLKLFIFLAVPCGWGQSAWINEIHYENNGADTNEAIEIVIENAEDLHLYEVSLFASDGGEYAHIYLDDSSIFHGDTVDGFSFFVWHPPTFQNGPADGIALLYNGSVVPGQFLSYEGTLTAMEGPVTGTTSTDIGATESDSNFFYESLQLTGTGSAYSDFSWGNPIQSTFGEVNMNQTMSGTTGNASPVIFNISQNPSAENVTPSSSVSVSAAIFDTNGISEAIMNWGTASGNLSNSMAMNFISENTYTTSSEIPPQAEGTAVFYTISATDGNSASITDEKTYLVGGPAVLGWQIMETDEPFQIDFETSVENVNEGEFSATGFQPFPETGQLDSNSWAIAGFSDGNLEFGGTRIIQDGDFTQNSSSGDVGTGGIYAFVMGSSVCLGVQPGGNDFTPGSITLRLQNKTGVAITGLQVSYDIFNRNNESRSNSFDLGYSQDNLNYTNTSAVFSSPEASADFPYWKKNPQSETIIGISVAPEAYFYLQWTGGDLTGAGPRDEFGLDNISVIANPVSSTYVFNNGWSPNDPNGEADFADNIVVQSGTASFDQDISVNNINIAATAVLKVENVLEVHGTISNNGNLIFVSDGIKLGQLGENQITGNIPGATVQRFIPAHRAFRFVSSAVNSTANIHANWQEGAISNTSNPNQGFGTHITGSLIDQENGFDATGSGNPSLFLFDNNSQEWYNIENTDINSIEKGKAYRLFVRGDRSIDLTDNETIPTNTVLRAMGDLVPGDHIENNLGEMDNDFNFIGNPFQAIVNMNAVLENSTNLNPNHYYIWNPNLNDRGGYVTIALPFGINAADSVSNQFLQPGQAAFVQTLNNGTASILFEEKDKTPFQNATNVFRGMLNEENTTFINMQLFETQDFLNNGPVADGLRLNFDPGGSNAVLPNDAPKMGNIDENIALWIDGNYLSIANRTMPTNGETLQLFSNQYRHGNYTFKIELNKFPENTTVFLKDDFLQIQPELMNDSVNFFNFSINENLVGSIASDRFSFVFAVNDLSVDNEDVPSLSIYPNPVRSRRFFISIPKISNEEMALSIYNAIGQKVYAATKLVKSGQPVEINAHSLKTGMFLVKVRCGGKSFVEKLFVF